MKNRSWKTNFIQSRGTNLLFTKQDDDDINNNKIVLGLHKLANDYFS